MTDSLAVRLKEEDSATVAQPSLADLTTACTEMDGEVLGEFVERNWDTAVGNVSGLMYLVKEMKRRFKNLDRKKQVNGEYRTIRGFRSFKKWFASFTGKSERVGYYLLETEEKKHERNAGRRSEKKKEEDKTEDKTDTVLARYADVKKKLTDLQRQRDNPFKDLKEGEAVDHKTLHEQTDPDPTISAVIEEVLALIAPDGYEIRQGDNGTWYLSEGNTVAITPEQQKAKRSAAAKKAATTRAAKKAAKKAAALPPPTQTATTLGECESCCDGTLATEVVNVTEFNSDGDKVCAKCAEGQRKSDRKYLIRQMSVQKVMGKFCTLKTLADLGGKPMDFGDGDVRTYPTVEDYLARVREFFLGSPRYDQTVVKEHIARLEKKMEAAQ